MSAQAPHGFTVRPYQVADEPAVRQLLAHAAGLEPSPAHMQWKFEPRQAGIENRWLALSGAQPVFHYGGIPLRFLAQPRELTAMISVDALTAPEFRRQGLLTRTLPQVLRSWSEAGVSFTLGLPNQQWGSRIGALGWIPLFPLRWMVRPLRPEVYLSRRMRWPSLASAAWASAAWNRSLAWTRPAPQGFTIERMAAEREGFFDAVWSYCQGALKFCAVRDRHWAAWRFRGDPDSPFEVLSAALAGRPRAYAAYRMRRTANSTHALLVDLFAAPHDRAATHVLIGGVVDALLETNAEAVMTLALPGTPLYRALRRHGFLASHEFMVHIIPFAPDLALQRMRDPTAWHLSGADFDVV